MIRIEAMNNKEQVEITLNIQGRGDDVAEEAEAIVTELYKWMLRDSKPMFVDHIAKMTAKGLALFMDGYDNKEEVNVKKEGAN